MNKPILKEQNLDNNRGLIDIEKPAPKDYVFSGKDLDQEKPLQDNRDWSEFLPAFEKQRNENFDTSGCVSFAALNCLEILQKSKGKNPNYSDRFLVVASETDPSRGNYFSKVAETIRKKGLVEEKKHPFNVDTKDEYYKKIPEYLYNQAYKWALENEFEYKWVDWNGVDADILWEALAFSPIEVSLHTWGDKVDGVYQRPDTKDTNHAVTIFDGEYGEYWKIFDHYEEDIKTMAWDYYFSAAMKFSVEPQTKRKLAKDYRGNKIYIVTPNNSLYHIKDMHTLKEARDKLGIIEEDWILLTETKKEQDYEVKGEFTIT